MSDLQSLADRYGWTDEEARLRNGICEIGKICYQRGLISAVDGTMSCQGELIVKGTLKGQLDGETVVIGGLLSSEQAEERQTITHEDVLSHAVPDDLVHFGMIPEMIGRLPCITTLRDLDEHAMTEILTKPKNALVKQYIRLFEMEIGSPGTSRASMR